MGRSSGASLTTGSNNIFLGKQSGNNVSSGTGNVILGGYTGTNTMNGFLVLSDGLGNIRMRWENTQNAIHGVDATVPTLEWV